MTKAVRQLVIQLSKLRESEKEEFWQALLGDGKLREDLHDALVLWERRDEPTRPFEEFEREERQRRARRLREQSGAA